MPLFKVIPRRATCLQVILATWFNGINEDQGVE
jgi:hypothetical protein